MNPGIAYALGGFLIWGLFPLYFRLLQGVPALEVVLHRYAWALVTMLVVLALLRRWDWLRPVLRSPKLLGVFLLCALLLAVNSLAYVYAVQTNQVQPASLGYFINPLVNVLLGVLVLRERLSRVKWAAVVLAGLGVAWLTWRAGGLPWIALVLAFSFAFYGLLRHADAFLDTIGFSGFNTALQAVECGLPVVTREGRFLRGRLASGILKRMGLTELVAQSDEDYVALAVRLARDTDYREQVRNRVAESRHMLFEDIEPIRALEDFLLQVTGQR